MMHPKRIIAALAAMTLLCAPLASCGEEERVTADPVIKSDAEVDTAPVVNAEEIDYKARLDMLLNIAPCDEAVLLTEAVGGEVTVTGYIGEGSELCIPSSIGGLPVTAIADSAFAENVALTAVAIPDSVTSIGSGILAGCTSLTALRTPLLGATADAKEQYLGYLFGADSYQNNPRDIPAALKLLRIGGAMETLPDYALYDCNDLTCVELPESIRRIGKFALYNGASLEAVLHLENAVTIGEYALSYCKTLKVLTLGENVEQIGFAAFEGCTALRIMTLPFAGASLNENSYLGYVFGAEHPDFARGYYPFNLERVVLLDSCTALGNYAFYECATLKEIVLPDSAKSVGVRAFYGCIKLWSVDLPDGLETIREAAFTGCDSLLSVELGKSLTSIGINAFYDCDSLQEVTLPATLKAIPASCFARCLSLKSVDLGGVTSVGAQAFRHCVALKTVTSVGSVELGEGNEALAAFLESNQ